MKVGIAYIVSNAIGTKHREIFETFCERSISTVKKHCKDIPVAVLVRGETAIAADYVIDGSDYLNPYIKIGKKKDIHGLIAAELLKTHIHEWSPFESTIYIDCDAFVMNKSVIDYANVLELGYKLSMATCASMSWKDDISNTNIRHGLFRNVPSYFPYWNFGVFGSNKRSGEILEKIREQYLSYCFIGDWEFRSTPHAQPAIVRVAHALSPNHGIFTMPTKYNCHFGASGGYVFSGVPVVLHLWKDVRSLLMTPKGEH